MIIDDLSYKQLLGLIAIGVLIASTISGTTKDFIDNHREQKKCKEEVFERLCSYKVAIFGNQNFGHLNCYPRDRSLEIIKVRYFEEDIEHCKLLKIGEKRT